MQGQLRGESLSITIKTECAHCEQPIQIEIDSDLNYHVQAEGADPLVFMAIVNFSKLRDPSIIDAF